MMFQFKKEKLEKTNRKESRKICLTDGNSRITVHRLIDFGAVMMNLPDGILLRLAVGIEGDGIVLAEVRGPDAAVVWTDVDEVADLVIIVVVVASVADPVICKYNNTLV